MKNKIRKWTLENLKKEALKYNSRNSFKKGSSGAYKMAQTKKQLDDICGHMKPKPTQWNLDKLILELEKHESLKDFRINNTSAYHWALKNSVIDMVLKSLPNKKPILLTKVELVNMARKYTRIVDFERECNKEYQQVKKRKIEYIAFKHMKQSYFKWDFRLLKTIANRYNTRSEFYEKNQKCYTYATNKGILEDVCKDMNIPIYGTDNDCIYVWNITGTNIYKVGITSYRLGIKRIKRVASRFNDTKIIFYEKTKGLATTLERAILSLGRKAKMEYFHGYTEFRHFSKKDLIVIKNMIDAGVE